MKESYISISRAEKKIQRKNEKGRLFFSKQISRAKLEEIQKPKFTARENQSRTELMTKTADYFSQNERSISSRIKMRKIEPFTKMKKRDELFKIRVNKYAPIHVPNYNYCKKRRDMLVVPFNKITGRKDPQKKTRLNPALILSTAASARRLKSVETPQYLFIII